MIQTPSYKEISKSGVFARFVLVVVVMLGFGVLLAVVGGFSPFVAFLVGWVCGFMSGKRLSNRIGVNKMIQDTSRIALKHFESDGRLNRREKTIVQFLLERDKPMTRQEISVGTKLPINIVSGRVYDLIHKKEVLIEFKKHRQCAITGELANTVTTNANRMLINDRKPEIKTGEYGQIAFC